MYFEFVACILNNFLYCQCLLYLCLFDVVFGKSIVDPNYSVPSDSYCSLHDVGVYVLILMEIYEAFRSDYFCMPLVIGIYKEEAVNLLWLGCTVLLFYFGNNSGT